MGNHWFILLLLLLCKKGNACAAGCGAEKRLAKDCWDCGCGYAKSTDDGCGCDYVKGVNDGCGCAESVKSGFDGEIGQDAAPFPAFMAAGNGCGCKD